MPDPKRCWLSIALAIGVAWSFSARAMFYSVGGVEPTFAVTCDAVNQRVLLNRIALDLADRRLESTQPTLEREVIRKAHSTGAAPLNTASRVIDCSLAANLTIRLRLAESHGKSWGTCGAVTYPSLSVWRNDEPIVLGQIVEDDCNAGYLRSATITAAGVEWCWVENGSFHDDKNPPAATCTQLTRVRPEGARSGVAAERAPNPEYGEIEVRHGKNSPFCNSMLSRVNNTFGQPDWRVSLPPAASLLFPPAIREPYSQGRRSVVGELERRGVAKGSSGARWVSGTLTHFHTEEEVFATVLDVDNAGMPAVFAVSSSSSYPSRTSDRLYRYLILRTVEEIDERLRSELKKAFPKEMKRLQQLFPASEMPELLSDSTGRSAQRPLPATAKRVPDVAKQVEISSEVLVEGCDDPQKAKGRIAACTFKGFEFGGEGTELWPFRSGGRTFFLAHTPVYNGDHVAVYGLASKGRLTPACVFRQIDPAYANNR